jgi:hypothetical protein
VRSAHFGVLAVATLGFLLLVVPTTLGATSLEWSTPADVHDDDFNAMACASESVCAGGTADGLLVSSIDPTGGAGAWTVFTPLPDQRQPFRGASCPSDNLCVAIDGAGGIWNTTNPAAGAWQRSADVGAEDLDFANDVSCPTVDLCVAVDGDGQVYVSEDPTGPTNTWEPTTVPGAPPMRVVSCPTVDMCVAADIAGGITTSTSPTFGDGGWEVTPGVHTQGIHGLSCPTEDLCVGTTYSGDVVTSTNPTGGGGAWTVTPDVDPNGLYPISCPTETFCVASTDSNSGAVISSTDPTGGAGAWVAEQINGEREMYPMSCPTTALCVTGDSEGDILYGAAPPLPPAPDEVATIVEIKVKGGGAPKGYIEERAGTQRPLAVGALLRIGDTAVTGEDTTAAFEFAIGGRVGVKPETKVKVTSERSARLIGVDPNAKDEPGGIWAKCDKLKEPMEVQTNGGIMGMKDFVPGKPLLLRAVGTESSSAKRKKSPVVGTVKKIGGTKQITVTPKKGKQHGLEKGDKLRLGDVIDPDKGVTAKLEIDRQQGAIAKKELIFVSPGKRDKHTTTLVKPDQATTVVKIGD